MVTVKDIKAREILDSKGDPTIEVEVLLSDGSVGLAGVPSGASTGTKEAFELRDNDKSRYFGKGVLKAVENINKKINQVLIGHDALNQEKIDKLMIHLDGTKNKSNLGGNATIGVSMAICKAAAISQKLSLYEYFGKLIGNNNYQLPQPLILIMEGGKHGDWATDIQEFFVIPKKEKFETFAERLRVGAEIFKTTGKILKEKGYTTLVGFEGAYAPREIISNEEAFQIMINSVEKAGYRPGEDVVLGIDCAASEFFKEGSYYLKREALYLKKDEWLNLLVRWCQKYPIWLLEDCFAEEDWEGWEMLMAKLGKKCQIVGDDLLVTNVKRIKEAIEKNAVNSVLIKPNQIGTITETLEAIKISHLNNLLTVISHRSGETNDDLIADLCVGCGSWQSKFGGPDRGERLAKYVRLLRIEEELCEK